MSNTTRFNARPSPKPARGHIVDEQAVQALRDLWRKEMYPHHDAATFDRFVNDLTAEGWDEVRKELAALQSVVASLLSAPPRAAEGWQPIETCPKQHDGLLLSDGKTVSQGGWLSQVDQGADYEGQCGAPSADWWSVDCISPTHWQFMPAPPGASAPAPREGQEEER